METKEGIRLKGKYHVVCYDKFGNKKWEDTAENLIVNQGIQKVLDDVFTGGADARVGTWYLGLTAATPVPNADDVLDNHPGWTEFTNYSGDRKEWDETRTNQTLTNTTSKASFTITTNASVIGGAFLCSADSGTSGILMSCSAFTLGNKGADETDVLEVTYSITGSGS